MKTMKYPNKDIQTKMPGYKMDDTYELMPIDQLLKECIEKGIGFVDSNETPENQARVIHNLRVYRALMQQKEGAFPSSASSASGSSVGAEWVDISTPK